MLYRTKLILSFLTLIFIKYCIHINENDGDENFTHNRNTDHFILYRFMLYVQMVMADSKTSSFTFTGFIILSL